MCGIAGFSLSKQAQEMKISRRLAKALLLDIESRGRDATGFAFRDSTGAIQVHKTDTNAAKFVRNRLTLPKRADTAILHTRMWTQGSPSVNDNNHPIRSGSIVGVHNGWLQNDHTLWGTLLTPSLRNAEVDSEVIFALLAHGKEVAGLTTLEALQEPQGNLAVAWMDEADEDNTLFLARGAGSPLVVCETQDGSVLFASTHSAIVKACKDAGLEPETIRDIEEGRLLVVKDGIVEDVRTFTPEGPMFRSTVSSTGWTASPTKGITDRFETKSITTRSDGSRTIRLAEAVATFEGDEYDRWAADRLCALEADPATDGTMPEPFATEWIYRDAFDAHLPVELAGCSEPEYFAQYAPRERALDKWMDGLGAGTDYVANVNTARSLKAFVRPGEDVTTDVAGSKCDAQIVSMPQEFPHGDYVLRAVIKKGSGQEVVLVERKYYEFHTKPRQGTLPGIERQAIRHAASAYEGWD